MTEAEVRILGRQNATRLLSEEEIKLISGGEFYADAPTNGTSMSDCRSVGGTAVKCTADDCTE